MDVPGVVSRLKVGPDRHPTLFPTRHFGAGEVGRELKSSSHQPFSESPLLSLEFGPGQSIESDRSRLPLNVVRSEAGEVRIYGWPIASGGSSFGKSPVEHLARRLPSDKAISFAYHGPFYAVWKDSDGLHLFASSSTPGFFFKRVGDCTKIVSCDVGLKSIAGTAIDVDALGLWLLGNINVDPFRTLWHDVVRVPGMCRAVIEGDGSVRISADVIPRRKIGHRNDELGQALEQAAEAVVVLAEVSGGDEPIFLVSSGIDGLVPVIASARVGLRRVRLVSAVSGYDRLLCDSLRAQLGEFLTDNSDVVWLHAGPITRPEAFSGAEQPSIELARCGVKSNVLDQGYKLLRIRGVLDEVAYSGVVVTGYGVDESLIWRRQMGSAYSSVHSATPAGVIDSVISKLRFLARLIRSSVRIEQFFLSVFDSGKMSSGLSHDLRKLHDTLRLQQLRLVQQAVAASITWDGGRFQCKEGLDSLGYGVLRDRRVRATARYLIANSAHQFRLSNFFGGAGRISYQFWDSAPVLVYLANRRRRLHLVPKGELFTYLRRLGFAYGRISRQCLTDYRGFGSGKASSRPTFWLPRSLLQIGALARSAVVRVSRRVAASAAPSSAQRVGGTESHPQGEVLRGARRWAETTPIRSTYVEIAAAALARADERGFAEGHLELNALQLALILDDGDSISPD